MPPSSMPLRVILFGGTGMVGAGALQACLNDADVESVLVVGRSSCGKKDPKLKEWVLHDLFALDQKAEDLKGYNACLFALGVTSVGMKEPEYTRITYDLTLAIARTLLKINPDLGFCYVSAAGADTSEKGRRMWARVRGRTENELRALPFRASACVRPAVIQPAPGIRSRTRLYQVFYDILGPILPYLQRLAPNAFTTSQRLSQAMLRVVRGQADRFILESKDINRLGA